MFNLCIFAFLATIAIANAIPLEPTAAEKKLLEAGFFEGDMRFPEGRNGLTSTNTRWSSKTVYFEISSAFSSYERSIIIGALNAIQSTTCVQFVTRTNQVNYVYVTRENSGCWSYVGMINGPQQLNLQGDGCVHHGIVIHEFLHALGFHHQQSATDRDNYVIIQYENIQIGTERSFTKYLSSTVTDFGVGYDYDSVMHYDEYAFSKNGQKTIIAKDASARIGQRFGLSSKDIAKIKAMYFCW